MMPAWGEVLGLQGVEEVASYVFSLNHHEAPADWVAAGKERFATVCAGCHGVDARGNALLGAPNLADNVWLYDGDFDTIKETIAQGRANQMPAHLQMLEDEFVAKGMTREDARVGQVAITVIFVASLVSLGWNLFANPTVTQSYASRVPDIGSR